MGCSEKQKRKANLFQKYFNLIKIIDQCATLIKRLSRGAELNDSGKKARSHKIFPTSKIGCFYKLDKCVTEKWNEEMPITRADIQLKALEITKELNIAATKFKVCVND